MRHWNGFAVTLALTGILQLSLDELAMAGQARWHPVVAQSYVGDLGVGPEVQVRLTSGETVRGPIAGILEREFLVDVGQSDPFEVPYTRIEDMTVTGLSLNGDLADPDAARRAVRALGADAHVMVRTTAGDELRGHIREVASDSFQLVLDDHQEPTEIRYDDVARIGKNLSVGATIAIVVGIVAAAAVIVAVATSNDLADILD